MSKLTTIVREIYDRTVLSKRVAALTGGLNAVESVVITNGGTGYTSAPSVGFTSGGGSGAAATATLLDGVVVSITITNHGSGYTSTPTVGFTSGGGSGAAATALLAATTLDAIPTLSVEAGNLQLSVVIGAVLYHYDLISGTTAESSPSVIRPDDYASSTNEKIWVLLGTYLNTGTILDGANLALGTVTGTKLGTATSQKLGLWNVTPVIQPADAAQAAVVLGNADNEIGGLSFSGGYTQAEVEALRDKAEELADDVRALSALLHALRIAGVNVGLWKGAA